MPDPHPTFDKLVSRLAHRSPLNEADREALRSIQHNVRRLTPGAHILRDGDRVDHCALLLSGFAYRYKITGEGARQIVSLHMAGEFVDLQNVFLGVADHGAQALTEAEIALIPRLVLDDLAAARPAIGRALWIDTLVDGSVSREWVVNVGRRDSRARIAHILCEFSLRLQAAGLTDGHRYELPMTQEQLADAVGLTSVHVNRVLKHLAEARLISRDRRSVAIEDWRGLCVAGDFNDRYLHRETEVQSRH